MSAGGRALDELGGLPLTELNQTPNASTPERGSRTVGDESHGREGKSPDHRLRSLSLRNVQLEVSEKLPQG